VKPGDGEGRTVGEVRRKVEKMTYEEETKGNNEVLNDRAPNGDIHEMDRSDPNNDSGEWEKIEKSEAIETESTGEGHKRKALDRSESSAAHIEAGEVETKRQKETPSVCPPSSCSAIAYTLHQPPHAPPPPEKRPPTSFSAFSSTASPFAASAARSASPFASTPTKPSPFASPGFRNYSSSFSPFAAKKAASPAVANEDTEQEKEVEAGPSNSTFGDILKAKEGKAADEEEKVHMTEQDGTYSQ